MIDNMDIFSNTKDVNVFGELANCISDNDLDSFKFHTELKQAVLSILDSEDISRAENLNKLYSSLKHLFPYDGVIYRGISARNRESFDKQLNRVDLVSWSKKESVAFNIATNNSNSEYYVVVVSSSSGMDFEAFLNFLYDSFDCYDDVINYIGECEVIANMTKDYSVVRQSSNLDSVNVILKSISKSLRTGLGFDDCHVDFIVNAIAEGRYFTEIYNEFKDYFKYSGPLFNKHSADSNISMWDTFWIPQDNEPHVTVNTNRGMCVGKLLNALGRDDLFNNYHHKVIFPIVRNLHKEYDYEYIRNTLLNYRDGCTDSDWLYDFYKLGLFDNYLEDTKYLDNDKYYRGLYFSADLEDSSIMDSLIENNYGSFSSSNAVAENFARTCEGDSLGGSKGYVISVTPKNILAIIDMKKLYNSFNITDDDMFFSMDYEREYFIVYRKYDVEDILNLD